MSKNEFFGNPDAVVHRIADYNTDLVFTRRGVRFIDEIDKLDEEKIELVDHSSNAIRILEKWREYVAEKYLPLLEDLTLHKLISFLRYKTNYQDLDSQ